MSDREESSCASKDQVERLLAQDELNWTLRPDPAQDQAEVVVTSARGNQRRAQRLGSLEFTFAGRVQRLTALRLLTPGADESAVTVQFRDRTNGHGTRRQGRHLDAWPIPEKPGQYWLDLNQAYNPGCAFSKHLDCPAGFPKKRLDLAVRMGERTPGHE